MPELLQSKVEYTVVNQQVYSVQLLDKKIETQIQFVSDNPNKATIQKYVTVENGFNSSECDLIEDYFNRIKPMSGQVEGKTFHQKTRDSSLRWLQLRQHPDSIWIYERIMKQVQTVNAENWQFRLDGFETSIQLTEYECGGHYTWHQDIGTGKSGLRKLSVSVQLSDPTTYEGGGLELHATQKPINMPRSRGTIVIFPSYTLHRVTPMNSGKRRSLVAWIGGLEAYK